MKVAPRACTPLVLCDGRRFVLSERNLSCWTWPSFVNIPISSATWRAAARPPWTLTRCSPPTLNCASSSAAPRICAPSRTSLAGDPRRWSRRRGARGRHRARTCPRRRTQRGRATRARPGDTPAQPLAARPQHPRRDRCPKGRARRITSRSSAWASRRSFDFEPLDHVR